MLDLKEQPYRYKIFLRHCLATLSICSLLTSTEAAQAVVANDAAPNCALTAIGGSQKINLREFKGKVIYVDFWASWCGPCAKSFPFLNEIHQQLANQGLQIVGVNLDENMEHATAFLANYPAEFTIAIDTEKHCATDFEVKAMPSSYIIDRNGIIHRVHLGFRQGEVKELREVIEKLLSDKATGL